MELDPWERAPEQEEAWVIAIPTALRAARIYQELIHSQAMVEEWACEEALGEAKEWAEAG